MGGGGWSQKNSVCKSMYSFKSLENCTWEYFSHICFWLRFFVVQIESHCIFTVNHIEFQLVCLYSSHHLSVFQIVNISSCLMFFLKDPFLLVYSVYKNLIMCITFENTIQSSPLLNLLFSRYILIIHHNILFQLATSILVYSSLLLYIAIC